MSVVWSARVGTRTPDPMIYSAWSRRLARPSETSADLELIRNSFPGNRSQSFDSTRSVRAISGDLGSKVLDKRARTMSIDQRPDPRSRGENARTPFKCASPSRLSSSVGVMPLPASVKQRADCRSCPSPSRFTLRAAWARAPDFRPLGGGLPDSAEVAFQVTLLGQFKGSLITPLRALINACEGLAHGERR